MAGFYGKNGLVKISGTTLAAVVSFNYDETADEAETTAMGDTGRTFDTNLPDGTGSIECRFINTDYGAADAAGIALDALKVGTEVTVDLIPLSGASSVDFMGLSGTCVINSYSLNVSREDIVGSTFGYHGVLTRYTG